MMLRSYLRLLTSKLIFPMAHGSTAASSAIEINSSRINVISAPRVSRSKAELLAKMLFLPSQSPPDSRLLKVAVVGFPNAGKSALVNMLTKWRVCAVSGKAHTTRSKQTVVFTKNNVQIAFVDLPGIVSMKQVKQFKLEKTFIRDPHAAIFDADMILIIVDSSNKYSRSALDPEILKILHFFNDKESVLVLNKIDKMSGNPTSLLDITRRLTAGVVNGRSSHLDAYENRFNHRALLAAKENALPRLTVQDIIYPRLPIIAHEAANRRLEHLQSLRALLGPPKFLLEEATQANFPGSPYSSVPPQIEQTNPTPEALPVDRFVADIPPSPLPPVRDAEDVKLHLEEDALPAMPENRNVTELDHEIIDKFFTSYIPEKRTPTGEYPLAEELIKADVETMEHEEKEVYLDSVIEAMKAQLMLNSASKEEVAMRKQRWRQLALDLRGVSSWNGFKEVFMVSSATGEGIENLREYLMKRAKPGKSWLLSPSLITDQEPNELIRMCLWAHCLNQLPKEVPYQLKFKIDECERAHFEGEGDDRIYVHARIRCPSERTLKCVLGVKGQTVQSLAGAVKKELANMFQTTTVVKLTVEMMGPSKAVLRQMRGTDDVGKVFPAYLDDGPRSSAPESITTSQL